MHATQERSATDKFSPLPVLALASGHGTVDVYGSFLAPLFPLFADEFGLSLTLIGTLASILTTADGLSQPLFGMWGDRMRRPWMATMAPLWVGAATGFLGWATGYAMVAGLLVLAGTGRSVFHPQGAAGVARYAGDRRGLAMSLFTAAGNMGFATGPLLATAAIALGGIKGTMYVIPLGFMISGLIFAVVFRDTGFRSVSWRPPPLRRVIEEIAEKKDAFLRLWLVVVLRSLTYFSLFTFLPMLFTRQGLSPVRTGIMVSLFLFGGATGGIVGGWLSDRLGEKKVIVISLCAAFPALQLALWSHGLEGVALLILGGACLLASAPVTVALAQRYTTVSLATASSLMLGLGWGVGGLLVTPIGFAADHLGTAWALRLEVLSLIVAAVLALRLPLSGENPGAEERG
jgi:FSR family fosmidomycin resistance protein-like MFS transporter